MQSPETVQKFIQLRAQGWTFQRIATELNVALGTVFLWSRKYHRDLQNARELLRDETLQSLELTRTRSLEYLSQDLRRVREELAKRDLSQLSTSRLMALACNLRADLDRAATPAQLSQEINMDEPNPPEFVTPVVNWEG